MKMLLHPVNDIVLSYHDKQRWRENR